MKNEIKKLVIFDFDGVLAETEKLAYKIHKDFNGNITWENFQGFADGNFHEGMDNAIKEGTPIIPFPDYYKRYEEGLETIGINDILRDTITKLDLEFRLAIVSSTGSQYISKFLEKENILNYFDDIMGHEIHTSKVIKINTLLEKYKVFPDDAIFITDTLGDILEAHKCEVKSIAVTWGLHKRESLKKGNPSMVLDDPRDLLEAIQNMLK